jgi:hypothetical protein
VADVGEEKALGDGYVCGVLVGGGVAGALVGVPLAAYMGITDLLLVVPLLFLFSFPSCRRPCHYHLIMDILQ